MPLYVKPPSPVDLPRKVRELERRLAIVESRLAYVSSAPTAVSGDVYDANKLWNGAFESGLVGWQTAWWSGNADPHRFYTDGSNPLDGQYSGALDMCAGGAMEIWWRVGWGTSVSGTDVFPTAPGKQWQLSALVRSSVDIQHARLDGLAGNAEADCYSLGANTTFVPAIDVPLSAGVATTLSGLITIPASRNFITIGVRIGLDDSPLPSADYTVSFDNVVLRAKL